MTHKTSKRQHYLCAIVLASWAASSESGHVTKLNIEPAWFDDKGHFKDAGAVAQFLQEAYEGKAITNPDFNPNTTPKCCCSDQDIKDLLAKTGGAATFQLFDYRSGCSNHEYIIKEAYDFEARNTMKLALETDFQQFAWTPAINEQQKHDYPILMLPIASIEYNSHGNHYLVIMPKAPGVEFLTFFKAYVEQVTATPLDTAVKQGVLRAYYRLGYTLGKAQQKIGIIHGDFHSRNVFYDKDTENVYWIDLNTLQKTPETLNSDFTFDIAYFIYVSNSHDNARPRELWHKLTKDQQNKWIEQTMKNLLQGYIDSYPQDKKSSIINNFKKGLNAFNIFGFTKENQPYGEVFDAVLASLT